MHLDSIAALVTWYRPDDYYGGSDWNWFIDSVPVKIQSSLHNRNHDIMIVEDSAEGLILYDNGFIFGFYAMNNYLVGEPIEIRLVCENGTSGREALKIQKIICDIYNNNDTRDWYVGCL